MKRLATLLLLSTLLTGCGLGDHPQVEEAERTAKRTVRAINPFDSNGGVYVEQRHYRFSPDVSHWETQQEFPSSWDGQDWDVTQWKEHPDEAVLDLFKAEIFTTHYMQKGKPVLVVGKNFYNVSDLDRRRSVTLFAERSHILERGHEAMVLVDWDTREVIGSYSKKGLFLN